MRLVANGSPPSLLLLLLHHLCCFSSTMPPCKARLHHERKKRRYTPGAHGDRQYPWRSAHQLNMAQFWLRQPLFYDKTQQHFKNKELKTQLLHELIERNRDEWEKIHTPLPTVTQVDAHLRNIRTRFVKVMKRKSEAPELTLSYTDQMIYERYQFLCPHIQRKRRTTTTTHTPTGDDDDDNDEDDDDEDDEDEEKDDSQSVQSQQPFTSLAQQGKGKQRGALPSPPASSLTCSEDTSEMEILQQAKNLIFNIRTPAVSGHERRVRDFSRYMESEMLRIPEALWDECSFTIMDVIRGFKSAQHQGHLSQQHAYQQNSQGPIVDGTLMEVCSQQTVKPWTLETPRGQLVENPKTAVPLEDQRSTSKI